MQGGAAGGVAGVDLGAALEEEAGDVGAGEEGVLAVLEEVLALQGVVFHQRQMQQGVARDCARVDRVDDGVDPLASGQLDKRGKMHSLTKRSPGRVQK